MQRGQERPISSRDMSAYSDLTAEQIASMTTKQLAEILNVQIRFLDNFVKTLAELQASIHGTQRINSVVNPVAYKAIEELKRRK